MGLYQRHDSKYWWMLVESTGKKSSTRVLLDAPTAEARKQQKALAHGVYLRAMNAAVGRQHDLPVPDRERISFRKYSEWYETHVIAKHRGAIRERQILAVLRARLGAILLHDISEQTVSEFETTRLADGLRPGAVNREVALLKAMLTKAVPEHLSVSPLIGRKLLRAIKPTKRIIKTADEEARLLAELTDPRDQALYIVAVDSLIRLSNVLDLRRDEDKGTHLALTDSKTGPYTVPLSKRARLALDSLPDVGPYFFAHRRTAKTARDRRGIIRRLLERACRRAGIPYGRADAGVTFHTATRATGATRMLRAGFDLRIVQAAGNWSDIRALQEYLHSDDVIVTRAVNKAAPKIDLPAAMKEAEARGKARRIAQARKAGQARQAKARITRGLRRDAAPAKSR
jgi:site-specific recombinase XerC